MSRLVTIEEDNLSVAWSKAFLEVLRAGEVAPLVVVVNNLGNIDPPEVSPIRRALDAALQVQGNGLDCHQVANTIFPVSLWNPNSSRDVLFERYSKILSRIRSHQGNHHGVYFQRLMAYGCDSNMRGGRNQLDHVISTWRSGNHRRTALQAAIMDPASDHTNQRRRGFPCLQQVAFAPIGTDRLAVTGFYATQYMFERAYGNYLGLCRLGRFMAHEMGLTLSRMVCIATPAKLGGSSKRELGGLAQQIGSLLQDLPSEPSPQGGEGAHA